MSTVNCITFFQKKLRLLVVVVFLTILLCIGYSYFTNMTQRDIRIKTLMQNHDGTTNENLNIPRAPSDRKSNIPPASSRTNENNLNIPPASSRTNENNLNIPPASSRTNDNNLNIPRAPSDRKSNIPPASTRTNENLNIPRAPSDRKFNIPPANLNIQRAPSDRESKIPFVDQYFKGLPSMTLTIRMTSKSSLLQYLYCNVFRSTALYWSRHFGDVGLILDNESSTDRKLAASLSKFQESMGINFKFYYEPLPVDPSIFAKVRRRNPGYNRQIFSSFFTDQYIDTSVIAWTDTDGQFTTPVTKETIFKGDQLRVKGMNTFEYNWIPQYWSTQGTLIMMGKPMMADFMTYFPVYMWRDTITNCRNFILKFMNVTTIDEAFLKTGPGGDLSPVNVIMTYAYYYERERYDWHIDIRGHDLQGYNKAHVTPGFELTPSNLIPEIHVTIHVKYYSSVNLHIRTYCNAIKNCPNRISDKLKTHCQPYLKSELMVLFEFCNSVKQEHVTTWCKDDPPFCSKLLNEHDGRVKMLIDEGVYDLDLRKIVAVEDAAKDMNVKCPDYFHS